MASSDTLGAATEVIADARAAGMQIRALGGIAVALRCPSARGDGPLTRGYSDLDVVTSRRDAPRVAELLEDAGYLPEERFNTMHGYTRMMFDQPGGLHLDVFVEEFVMCHRLPLGQRLAIHDTTVPLADLLLTKLQVAELNEKDVTDAAALLLDHDLTGDESGINTGYVCEILSRDWGWWRTVTQNLATLTELTRKRIAADHADVVGAMASQLTRQIDDAPKSVKWKMRARAGDRLPWRDEPEESH